MMLVCEHVELSCNQGQILEWKIMEFWIFDITDVVRGGRVFFLGR
jgi:hypothetical protein